MDQQQHAWPRFETLEPLPVDPSQRLSANGIELDLAAVRVRAGGVPLALAPREFALLRCFMSRPGEVLNRQELAKSAWGEPDCQTMKVYVNRLRTRLTAHGIADHGIRTVRNEGYRFEVLGDGGRDDGRDDGRDGGRVEAPDRQTIDSGDPDRIGAPAADPGVLQLLSVGAVHLNLDGMQLRASDRSVDLNVADFELLRVLMRHAGQALSGPQIASEAWESSRYDRKYLSDCIYRVRQRLREVGVSGEVIRAVRGVGYVFDAVNAGGSVP